MQLISLDYVGAFQWQGRSRSYLVIIDHSTRFLVGVACSRMDAESTVQLLRERWISVFQTPHAVLTDRGTSFMGKFREYVTGDLCCHHVMTSAYYPQGNGVNEAAHKGLNSTLAAMIQSTECTFEEALACAVTVHNATPHVATGESLYCMMFGLEPVLPSWQRFQRGASMINRANRLAEMRHKQAMRALLMSRAPRLSETTNLRVGDYVVYLRSEYERKNSVGRDVQVPTTVKFSERWSLWWS